MRVVVFASVLVCPPQYVVVFLNFRVRCQFSELVNVVKSALEQAAGLRCPGVFGFRYVFCFHIFSLFLCLFQIHFLYDMFSWCLFCHCRFCLVILSNSYPFECYGQWFMITSTRTSLSAILTAGLYQLPKGSISLLLQTC